MKTDEHGTWLHSILDSLECGVVVIGEEGRIAAVNAFFASLLGLSAEKVQVMAPRELIEHIVGLVDVPPLMVRERRLLPTDGAPIVCEEFELNRPSRSVVRWVARRLADPRGIVVIASDITTEVDLTSAYERLAMTDRLTGLANRRAAERDLTREVERLRRYGTPVSCGLLDIDHFKQINDRHGHKIGDMVLREVSNTIVRMVRDSDAAARWGGEEFLILMPSTERSGALACVERIRNAVARLVIVDLAIPVAVSGGVAEFRPGESVSEGMARADRQLYEAKNSGRNCTRG